MNEKEQPLTDVNPPRNANVALTFRLPPSLKDQLKKYAESMDLSVSQVIRHMIKYVNNHPDIMLGRGSNITEPKTYDEDGKLS